MCDVGWQTIIPSYLPLRPELMKCGAEVDGGVDEDAARMVSPTTQLQSCGGLFKSSGCTT